VNASRILDRLWEAERAEADIHLRSDYRQAWICVSLAVRGEAQPFVASSYRIYGTHPDDVWPKIMANRKARLGKEYSEWFDQACNLQPDLPRKKPAIVLMFPKLEVQNANVEQTGSMRRAKKSKGNLYEMPAASRSEKHQPLRILPA
jgi:hypothetical protein